MSKQDLFHFEFFCLGQKTFIWIAKIHCRLVWVLCDVEVLIIMRLEKLKGLLHPNISFRMMIINVGSGDWIKLNWKVFAEFDERFRAKPSSSILRLCSFSNWENNNWPLLWTTDIYSIGRLKSTTSKIERMWSFGRNKFQYSI